MIAKEKIFLFVRKAAIKYGYDLIKINSETDLARQFDSNSCQKEKIRNYFLRAQMSGDEGAYDEAVRYFIPNVPISNKSQILNSRQFGFSNINTYRRLDVDGGRLFEKIYFNDEDLGGINYFYKNIYGYIQEFFVAPNLVLKSDGSLLSAFYYEFLELEPISSHEAMGLLIAASKKLDTISRSPRGKDLISTYHHSMRRIKPVEMKGNYEESLLEMSGAGVNVEHVMRLLMSSRFVLSHGDLKPQNLFKHNVLIDWDHFSISPMGKDPAVIYFFYQSRGLVDSNYKKWLEQNYSDFVATEEWGFFALGFVFYLYVYLSSHGRKRNKSRQRILISLVKDLRGRSKELEGALL